MECARENGPKNKLRCLGDEEMSPCVMIGDYRFATIPESYAFLRDGGNANKPLPCGWAWVDGFVHKTV